MSLEKAIVGLTAAIQECARIYIGGGPDGTVQPPPKTTAEALTDLPEDTSAKEVTLEDVKQLVIKIVNTESLGKAKAFEVLQKFGIKKLSLMKRSQYADVKAEAERVLAAGVK